MSRKRTGVMILRILKDTVLDKILRDVLLVLSSSQFVEKVMLYMI